MILDTSAITSILTSESDRDALIDALAADPNRSMSAASLLEAGIVLEARFGIKAASDLDQWISVANITIVPFDARQSEIARLAWRKYGKGNHPAALNFGDCCVYALSKVSGEPILCKANDFPRTDIGVVSVSSA